ncbi:glycogen debranching enzyme [Holotrichia oblita]|nr:glycogen debranching enzyme [Holotrichia oblita]
MKQHIQLSDSNVLEWVDCGRQNYTKLHFKNFKPGSIVAIKVSLPKIIQESVRNIRDLLISLSRNDNRELSQIIGKMSLADLNRTIYRCDREERDEDYGFSSYHIPNSGSLFYCGLQGFMSLLENIRPNNDLGHPMCGNLREGNWMIDYIWQRLQVDEGTRDLGFWIEKNTMALKNVPRYLVPSYFDAIITRIYVILLEHTFNFMSDFVRNGSTFVKSLALGSVQFGAVIGSAPLPQLASNINPPKPPSRRVGNEMVQACVTLSAGLPHFSVGYMRNWGRDTFIALRGLFMLTGRYDEARYIILAYGGCLRHGLIPNLLDGGRNARFNCRDAVWWWLYCIYCYVRDAPCGNHILNDHVARLYPTDESRFGDGVAEQKLQDVIQEALRVHFQGLIYRERNAGRQIDEHMSDKGFTVQIGVHPETGFVFGGNDGNCGTWMDKMGSSNKAGNRGKPATPRDGSAVEIVALSKCVVSWLHELNANGQYAYDGVERVGKNNVKTKWTFAQWAKRIQENFERYFWVNTEPVKGELRPDLIHKRGIYKDCHGATQEWTDFQLRCNFPVAMCVAPELFQPRHAWIALQNAEKYLLGPLGMKTLDPDDWAYCGDYDNSNDSDVTKVAHGFNYHQGPEWVWPIGYFLRAKLHYSKMNGQLESTISDIKVRLSKHFTEIQTTAWKGLPELTNSNGSFCNDSSRTQAWSMSSVLEVLYDLQKIDGQKTYVPN